MISFQFRQRDKVIAYQRQIFSAILNRDAAEAIAAFDALIDYQSSVYDMAVQRREEKQSAAAAGSLAGS
jgi:DNA-binding GntR family transcriptional regulator